MITFPNVSQASPSALATSAYVCYIWAPEQLYAPNYGLEDELMCCC